MIFKTTLIGNLGGDAVVRTTDKGSIAVSFTVAVAEKRNGQDFTYWVNCTYWRTAEQGSVISSYLTKGKKVYVEGKPNARPYLDKEGKPAASLDITVMAIELLGDPVQQKSAPQNYSTPMPQQQPKAVQQPTFDPNDDVPF